MLSYGSVAVALVQRRVMVVQGLRPHDECERYLDVYTFTPSSDTGRTFLVSDAPYARINSTDLLAVFDEDEDVMTIPHDILELPQKAYDEFNELSSRRGRRFAGWAAWKGKFR